MNINSVNHPYKSIDQLTFKNIPKFWIISGVNGAGKSQLLEMIHKTLVPVAQENANPEIVRNNSLTISDFKCQPDEVLFAQSSFSIGNVQEVKYDSMQNIAEHIWLYTIDRNLLPFEKQRSKDSIKIENYMSKDNYMKLLMDLKIKTGKEPNTLEFNEFVQFIKHDFVLQNKGNLMQEINNLFLSYHVKFRDLCADRMSDIEIQNLIGPPPWKVLNEILNKSDLGLQCNHPEGMSTYGKFKLELTNTISKNIQVNSLSSGEKVILTTLLWLYSSENHGVLNKIILLDEPDAHLHPKQSKEFIRILDEVLVKKYGARVIMTTHSPSTVALAPEESLYFMQKPGTQDRIKKITKKDAIKGLLQGVDALSILPEKRIQVFVESDADVLMYSKIYELLMAKDEDIFVNFISSGVKSRVDGNVVLVKTLVTSLRNAGNEFVHGVIDWDVQNSQTQHIHILGDGIRYGIENFILDPLFIGAYLIREQIIKPEEIGLSNDFNYTLLKSASKVELEKISMAILEKLEFKDTVADLFEAAAGLTLLGSATMFRMNGHNYEQLLKEKFPALQRHHNAGALLAEILNKVIIFAPNLLCNSFNKLFVKIQKN
ncbi:hypothetical protein CIK05_01200 [Bdellovibrio sp. qaytius]|nr:hypothetical protein CIK05_01200 [Bdellovibrio sp. qaytius]